MQSNTYNKKIKGKGNFTGVYPSQSRWKAQLRHKGVQYYLGTFNSEIEAAKV